MPATASQIKLSKEVTKLDQLLSCHSPVLPNYFRLHICPLMLSYITNLLWHLKPALNLVPVAQCALRLYMHILSTVLAEKWHGIAGQWFQVFPVNENAKSVVTCLWIFILYIAERKIASGALLKCFQLGITFLKSKPLYLQACCYCQSQPLF